MEIISICNVHYFYNHFYTPFVIKYNDHSPMFIKNGVKKFPDKDSGYTIPKPILTLSKG